MPLPTIDLDPQDGDVELFEAIERCFALKLTQSDVGHWKTLGDIEDTLARSALPGRTAGPCPTLVSYHRLRAALTARGMPRAALRPDAKLDRLSDGRPAALFRHLRKTSGLRLPASVLGWPGTVGTFMISLSLMSVAVWLLLAHWTAATLSASAMLAGIILIRVDRGSSPPGIATLGDLAARAADLSRSTLAGETRAMPGDIWRSLAAVVADTSGHDPASLGRRTYLFRSVLLAGRAA